MFVFKFQFFCQRLISANPQCIENPQCLHFERQRPKIHLIKICSDFSTLILSLFLSSTSNRIPMYDYAMLRFLCQVSHVPCRKQLRKKILDKPSTHFFLDQTKFSGLQIEPIFLSTAMPLCSFFFRPTQWFFDGIDLILRRRSFCTLIYFLHPQYSQS